jgi:hypothetical protein
MASWICLCAVLSLSARASAAAEGDDRARGKALLAEGLSLLDNGHAKEALADFEAAYRIVPSPKVLFNMGLAHQALGNSVAALECFEGFLGELPDAPEDARSYAEQQVGRLRMTVSFVDISANLPSGEVSIDGRAAGLLPLKKPILVEPGPHVVSIVLNGQEVSRQQITTVGGKTSQVFAVSPSASVESRGRPWQRTAFWVATGLASVALVGGITEHVLYESRSSDYRDLLGKNSCAVGAPERGHCESLRSDANASKTLAWVGYSAAAVSAGAALAFLLLEPKSEPPSQRVACTWFVGLAGISCAGRY